MEYHDIFSLDKNEMGCMDAAEHIIELLDEEPFKERFRWVAPPLLDEVQEHLQEMLDGGAIWPSQSAWCNAVVLVQKKDGGLWFCIDFRRLNTRTKKDSYPMPSDARDHGVLGQSPVLFNNGFEVQVLASEDVGEVLAVYCFHRWKYGNF